MKKQVQLTDVFLALLLTVSWVGILEVGLRAAGHCFPGSLYALDEARLHRLRANAEAWMTVERDSYVRINNVGYHDRDRTIGSGGAKRIAVLGASDVAAMYVPVERGLTASIERCLEGTEVLNFGVEAYGLAQALITLETDVWQFHPTTVILVVSPRTTIWKSVPELNPDPMPYPYLDYEGDRLAILPHSVPSKWDIRYTSFTRSIVGKSQLLCMVNQGTDRALSRFRRRFASRSEKVLTPLQQFNWSAASARPPRSALETKAWSISVDSIRLFSKACRAHHAQLWLVVLDSAIEVSPNLKERQDFLRDEKLVNFGYLERRLETVAEQENIHYLAVGPQLAEYTARTGHTVHGFGRVPPLDAHLNEEGNMIVGQLVGEALKAESSNLLTKRASEQVR